jgi:two-component system KDP operon response regulator KdpE
LINRESHEVFVRGQNAELRPAQYTLLMLLIDHANAPVSVETIAQAIAVRNPARAHERVKWHIWKLRQAIELDPQHPTIILTEAGQGYRLDMS